MDVAMFLLLVLMLISASSMFDLHVLVAVFVMFNTLELIMEIVPNYSTGSRYIVPVRKHFQYNHFFFTNYFQYLMIIKH